MRFAYVFLFISIILWILPLFKQYKTEYFVYFLILALTDPLVLVFLKLFHIVGNRFIVFVALLLLWSLITNTKIKRLLLLSALPVFIIAVSYSLENKLIVGLGCAVHLIILGVIATNLLNRLLHTQTLNFFLSLLILYELIYVLKYLAIILNNETGAMSAFIGSVSQIILAVLFIFINIDSKEFLFVRKKE
jgi:hypothetical protein